MAKIKIMIDPIGNTLNMWWRTPKKDDYVEESETSNDVIVYDKDGKAKGIEVIGFFPKELNVVSYLGKNRLTKYFKSPDKFITDIENQ